MCVCSSVQGPSAVGVGRLARHGVGLDAGGGGVGGGARRHFLMNDFVAGSESAREAAKLSQKPQKGTLAA